MPRPLLRQLIIALAALTSPVLASAQDDTADTERLRQRGADVVAVMKGEKSPADVFTDEFNAEVPEAQLRALAMQLEAQFGALGGVEAVEPTGSPGAADLALRFEQAIASGPMQLEATEPHRVAGLRLVRFDPLIDSDTSVLDQIRELPGNANLLLAKLDGSSSVLEHNADTPLALGSTFKLYVLSTLVQEIAAGKRQWDDVVKLDTRSYPSGILQDWPAGTPMTLQTLATLMISISDNTATDQLMAVLGREAVEQELRASGHSAPELTLPFMTTREMFVIRSDDGPNLGEYASLGTPERLAVLQSLQDRELTLERVLEQSRGTPRAIEVEWFASARDIARILDRLKDDPVALEIMGINPVLGEEASAGWNYVGYKGGSEPGVLNYSWLLRDNAGEWYVLTAGWNSPEEPVGTAKLLGIAQSALTMVDPAVD